MIIKNTVKSNYLFTSEARIKESSLYITAGRWVITCFDMNWKCFASCFVHKTAEWGVKCQLDHYRWVGLIKL